MFQPKFQGDEHPAIARIEWQMQAVLLDVRIMQRAAPADMAKRRAKIRAGLVDIAKLVMDLTDEFAQ